MTFDYEHLDEPKDPTHAEACAEFIRPHLPLHAKVVSMRQKGDSTCIFIRSDPSMSEGAIDRLVVCLQEHPSFKSMFHFTQGRKMVAYFGTPTQFYELPDNLWPI